MAKINYEGGLDQLGSVEDAVDPHEAVGRWWARAILNSNFDNGAEDSANTAAKMMALLTSLESRNGIQDAISGFAEALSDLSREGGLDYIRVDYHPDPVLVEAADLARMPANDLTTFPWKSFTSIDQGVVYARMGYDSERRQIWPPTEN